MDLTRVKRRLDPFPLAPEKFREAMTVFPLAFFSLSFELTALSYSTPPGVEFY
jgi:hypothetical protein